MNWSLCKDILMFFELGFSLKTAWLLLCQLIKESINPSYRRIRSMFQAPVAFDFYKDLLCNTEPEYTCFFTNHVAGMMHRYWKYTFPEEFGYTLSGDEDHFKSQNILRAMAIADEQIEFLKNFADKNDYILMIGSSMGQEAIDRGEYLGDIRIEDFNKFYEAIEFSGAVKNNLAMQPDFAFSFKSEEDLDDFRSGVKRLTSPEGEPLFSFKETGLTLNCNIRITKEISEKRFIYRDTLPLALEEFGIEHIFRDQGTGYHQPKGIWIIYKKDIKPMPYREQIDSTQIAPTILDMFGIKKPSYMKAPLKIKDVFIQN